MIGVRDAAKATPDGYTHPDVGHWREPAVANPGYDLAKDFTPIGLIASIPIVIMANPSVPVKSMSDIVALAKKEPGKLNHRHPAVADTELFRRRAIQRHDRDRHDIVTYKGTGPLTSDLLGGHVRLAFNTLPPAIGNIKAGTIRAIAVAAPQRLGGDSGRADDRRIRRCLGSTSCSITGWSRRLKHTQADRRAAQQGAAQDA